MAEDRKPDSSKKEEAKDRKIRLVPNKDEQYKPMKATITCGKCGKEWEAVLQPCVNISLHPDEKEKVLDGSFFHRVCPSCGETISVFYPCLYDDMQKALMIYLLPEDTEKALEALNAQQKNWSPDMLKAAKICKMRAVGSLIQLVEKIKIFDEGLDDRYVELTKPFIFAQFQKAHPEVEGIAALYEKQNGKNGYTIFCKDGKQFWAEIPEGVYEEVERIFKDEVEKKTTTEYEMIGPGWAHDKIATLMGKSE